MPCNDNPFCLRKEQFLMISYPFICRRNLRLKDFIINQQILHLMNYGGNHLKTVIQLVKMLLHPQWILLLMKLWNLRMWMVRKEIKEINRKDTDYKRDGSVVYREYNQYASQV